MNSQEIVKKYNLQKHPEGGWYKEIIRSENQVQYNNKKRDAVTSIYFLLEQGQISKWHKVDSDEIWIFLDGDKLELHQVDLINKKYSVNELDKETRQILVPKNNWQAAKTPGSYALMACIVAPGFEFEGFKLLDNNSIELDIILGMNDKAREFI